MPCCPLTRTSRSKLMVSKQQLPQTFYWWNTWKSCSSLSLPVPLPKDLELCFKQADFPELLQNEDVRCHRNCAHDFWGDTQSLQPYVSLFHQACCCSITQVLVSKLVSFIQQKPHILDDWNFDLSPVWAEMSHTLTDSHSGWYIVLSPKDSHNIADIFFNQLSF